MNSRWVGRYLVKLVSVILVPIVGLKTRGAAFSSWEQSRGMLLSDLCEFIGPRSRSDSPQLRLLSGRCLAAKDTMGATSQAPHGSRWHLFFVLRSGWRSGPSVSWSPTTVTFLGTPCDAWMTLSYVTRAFSVEKKGPKYQILTKLRHPPPHQLRCASRGWCTWSWWTIWPQPLSPPVH